jgi:hypothetical protein
MEGQWLCPRECEMDLGRVGKCNASSLKGLGGNDDGLQLSTVVQRSLSLFLFLINHTDITLE